MRKIVRGILIAGVVLIAAFAIRIETRDSSVHAQSCSGSQATSESDSAGTLYVAQNQKFHVNINLPGISSQQLTDIQNGIQSWAGTSGISVVFDSSSPGSGVVSVGFDSSIPSAGMGFWNTAGTTNQIVGGKISFNFGFKFGCTTGVCLAYDSSAPNADLFLTGLAAHEMGHVLGLSEPPDAIANPCTQTSTSVMGGGCGTNNNGEGGKPAPTSTSPTACDKQHVKAQTTANSSGGGGGGKSGGPYQYDPGDPGGSGSGCCYTYDEWDDATNTLTDYSTC